MLKKKCNTLKFFYIWCVIIAISVYVFHAKVINEYVFEMYFQHIKKNKIKKWFNHGVANYAPENFHHASRWHYLTTKQFEEIVLDGISKMDPKIKNGNKIFELGIGVGAALKVIERHFGEGQLHFGGSDIAENTIHEVKKNFPKQESQFFVHDMVQKHETIPDNYYDHVVSFGALGMYLTKDDMIKAIQEAVRITKPGGSLLFTNFIEPDGHFVGSIVDKVEKSFFENHAKELGIQNVKTYDMKHQGDRYQVVAQKVAVK